MAYIAFNITAQEMKQRSEYVKVKGGPKQLVAPDIFTINVIWDHAPTPPFEANLGIMVVRSYLYNAIIAIIRPT